MELWNSLPDASPSRPVSWTIPLSAENASVLTESVAPSDLYFSVQTKFTYLLTLQKKQLKQYIISCKTVADTSKIIVLNTKKPRRLQGDSLPDPPPGALPPGPPLGVPPPDPHYRLVLPRSPWVCV